jgi:hypothetical protein
MCLLVECILVENNRWKLRPSCNIGRRLDYHKIPNDDREDTLVRVSILCIPIRTWLRLGFVALHSQSVKFNCGAGTMSKSLESYEEIIEGFDSRERESRNRSANTPLAQAQLSSDGKIERTRTKFLTSLETYFVRLVTECSCAEVVHNRSPRGVAWRVGPKFSSRMRHSQIHNVPGSQSVKFCCGAAKWKL